MKNSFLIFIYLLVHGACTTSIVRAQTSSDFFPAKLGSAWRYQQFTLDTAQKQISGSKIIVTDSLTGIKDYAGKTGYLLVNNVQSKPDTAILFVQGDSVSFYNGGFPKRGIGLVADSLGIKFLPQALGWYTYMKLKNPPRDNAIDTLFRRDSTIYIDQVEFPLTLVITRTRRPAGLVTVPAGNFPTAVPFELNLNVDTWTFTPLGWWAVPLLRLTDTIFIAKNNWVVKEVQGSTYFPLTTINNDSIPKFRIPGYVKLLEKLTLTGIRTDERIPERIYLGQNYPNPFNGITNYELRIRNESAVTLGIFDLLGREVATLVNERLLPGTYRIHWDSGDHPSGIYFYRLRAGDYSEVKKMIIQK
jgi:hypothetical protein